MSTLTPTIAGHRSTLADRLIPRTLATDIVLVVTGAAVTAASSMLFIPIEPVPITMQTLAVLLVGSSLGAARGALSMILYVALGAIGLPIYADGEAGVSTLLGSTGGYLIGFIAAAALTGWLAERNWDKKYLGAALSFGAGTVVTFIFGLTWLAIVSGGTLEQVLAWGLYPFILGGAIKAGLAAGIIPTTWKVAGWIAKRREADSE